jgi:hypothetical protein
MLIPRVWVHVERELPWPDGSRNTVLVWGWAERDRGEAEQRALERIERIAARLLRGDEIPWSYGYPASPPREEITRELPARDGRPAAIVTRNRYGCLVLNTARVLFADVDLERPPPVRGWIARLFGAKRLPAAPVPDEAETLARIRTGLAKAGDGSSFRIYRTAGGFRVLATDPPFEPGSDASERIMQAIGTDLAFVRLCRSQQSFRARLTPKPHRCGLGGAPGTFPREDAATRKAFESWLAEYDRLARGHATCRLVEKLGSERTHEEAAPLVQLHDEATRVALADLPLA